jgi:hypothetical protein
VVVDENQATGTHSMKSVISENLQRLWAAEDQLWAWAIEVVHKQDHLLDFLEFIETYMSCVEQMRRVVPDGDRHFALASLFLRTFDDLSHALRYCMSGNYRGSAMYLRDLLETDFLLDYLMAENGRPEAWLKASDEDIRTLYAPSSVRTALDQRDGFTERKRKQRFDILSVLGVHPSPKGLELNRDGGRQIRTGPFKHSGSVQACIEEAARACLTLSSSLMQYLLEVPNVSECRTVLGLQRQKIGEKHLGIAINPSSARS